MEFEFDPAKSHINKQKHGIDFTEAQMLWDDDRRIVFPVRSMGEERFAVIGQIRNKIWAAFITHRGDRIRIISVRRAREKEIENYEENF